MIIKKKDFDASLFFETSVLRESPLPSRDSQFVLLRMLPHTATGWAIQWRSSHSLHDTLKHLVLKGLIEDLNKRERQVLQLLSAGVNSLWFELIKQLFQLIDKKQYQGSRLFYWMVLEDEQFTLLSPYNRSLRSYEPRLTVTKFWVEPARIPPKRYIGVGHNDGGQLGSSLSWKELMSPDEGEILESELEHLKSIFRRFTHNIKNIPSLDPAT